MFLFCTSFEFKGDVKLNITEEIKIECNERYPIETKNENGRQDVDLERERDELLKEVNNSICKFRLSREKLNWDADILRIYFSYD